MHTTTGVKEAQEMMDDNKTWRKKLLANKPLHVLRPFTDRTLIKTSIADEPVKQCLERHGLQEKKWKKVVAELEELFPSKKALAGAFNKSGKSGGKSGGAAAAAATADEDEEMEEEEE